MLMNIPVNVTTSPSCCKCEKECEKASEDNAICSIFRTVVMMEHLQQIHQRSESAHASLVAQLGLLSDSRQCTEVRDGVEYAHLAQGTGKREPHNGIHVIQ